jgi:hypothetical protein
MFGTTKMRDIWYKSFKKNPFMYVLYEKLLLNEGTDNILMFKNKLKTGVASGADIGVQLIRSKILEEIGI